VGNSEVEEIDMYDLPFNSGRRLLLQGIAISALVYATPTPALTQVDSGRPKPDVAREIPGFVRRGLPGPGHAALRGLEGDWRVEKALYVAVGTRERPAVSTDLIARRRWIAGGRYLQDVTEGSIAGGPYYRMGLLGYSNVDARYEWVTVDGTNANMMIYRSDRLTGPPPSGAGRNFEISMSGTFTDQGLIGEETTGRLVGQRTVIRIQSAHRHEIDLYFTPPGRPEVLIDKSIYTRMQK
jgi:hypothetical protein